ncbi:hypothetical protein [Armatimonas rosea]|uniref:Uncharacterized protein (DUF1778 family) n=1 Tax=Armatimonas rosea TaxID=685828 RepID=A0A7W9SM13_ARMRO|nr:hypothetical protein [Armatimonas rosea]MBB6048654.1 uncharacterized protein (DUF1778 family) [Armatimonas rosea]
MTLTVEVSSDLAEVLRKAARAAGTDVPTFLLDSARQRLVSSLDAPSEADLLERISTPFPAPVRERRQELLELRDSGALNEAETSELFALQEQLDTLQLTRWKAIGELAKRRGKTLLEMADALGIPSSEVR